jgi:hypothetical protein
MTSVMFEDESTYSPWTEILNPQLQAINDLPEFKNRYAAVI